MSDIHHYIELNFQSFVGLVNTLGDVRVYVPYGATDFTTGFHVDRGGCYSLNGETSLQYVRSRSLEYYDERIDKFVPANDRAGFVSNRVLMPMINEAFYAWMEGVAEPQNIDQIMMLGCNFPMGPLRLADFIGLDVCHDIMIVLYRELGDQKYFPCPKLRQLVLAKRLGDKSGRGVYEYPAK